MTTASELKALRRLSASRGLRLSKHGDSFYLIDPGTNAIVLGWGLSGGVHIDEVTTYLRTGQGSRTA